MSYANQWYELEQENKQLNAQVKKQAKIICEYGFEAGQLKDKLHRRNMQIKDLKGQLEKTTTQLAYLTEHLLTVEEYHPEYLEDIKNNMI